MDKIRINKAWLIVLSATLLATGVALAAPPLISYQGRLENLTPAQAGQPLSLVFRIYDGAGPGAALVYEQTMSQVVVDQAGAFNVLLGPSSTDGNNTQLPDAFADGERYIAVSVDGGAELPRQQVLSVPYALEVANVPTEIPMGAIMPMWGSGDREGWLVCDGRIITDDLQYVNDENTFYGPDLGPLITYLKQQAIGQQLEGNRAYLPDLRGMFLRGAGQNSDSSFHYDDGPNHALGDKQHYQMLSHGHHFDRGWRSEGGGANASRYTAFAAPNAGPSLPLGHAIVPINGVELRHGDESRPQNVGVNFLIRY